MLCVRSFLGVIFRLSFLPHSLDSLGFLFFSLNGLSFDVEVLCLLDKIEILYFPSSSVSESCLESLPDSVHISMRIENK